MGAALAVGAATGGPTALAGVGLAAAAVAAGAGVAPGKSAEVRRLSKRAERQRHVEIGKALGIPESVLKSL
jgi:hypothetical protein